MELRRIILVFKTHFDIGFTDLSSRVIDGYADDMLRKVIDTCRGTRDMGDLKYVWTMPSWPLLYIVKHCRPELKTELDRLIESGQVVWHALPFTSHTDFCSRKEYMEGLEYSRELARLYHKPLPVSGKMTDVPGHSLMLPDILDQAGIRFLHLGCNEFASPPDVPPLFFWRAPSGKQVLTMYSPGGYGTGLFPPEDWEFPVWMALMHTHDNCGPQSADAIRSMAEEIRTVYKDAEIVCGTMDDFYRELSACDLSKIPVFTGDMADTWIHGVGAYPEETASIRRGRSRMEGLEALWAKKAMEGSPLSPEQAGLRRQYYEQVALFEEHTWGADVKTWMSSDRVYGKKEFLKAKTSESYRFMEASWEEQRARARESSELLMKLETEPESGSGERNLFHGGSSPYTGWVKLPKELDGCLVSAGGKECICDRIGDDWCCYADELPGFTAVPLEYTAKADRFRVKVKEDNGIRYAENHRYRIAVSAEKGIEAVYDKKLCRDILRSTESEGVFAYRYDRYGYDDINEYLRAYGYHFTTWGIQDYGRENYPFCGHEAFQPVLKQCEIEGNTVRLTYTAADRQIGRRTVNSAEEYGDAVQVVTEVILPAAGEELFVQIQLKEKQESPMVESGSFLLPVACGQAEYRMQKGGMLLNPRTDLADRANHSLYCLENGMAVLSDGWGVCLKTMDAALVSLGGPGVYHYAPRFEDKKQPCIYVNLFNNMWGTNFPQWISGSPKYFFSLEGIDGIKEEQISALLSQTADTVRVTGKLEDRSHAVLPRQMKLIGSNTCGDKLYLQFQELSGTASERIFTADGYRITPVNQWGEAQGPSEENRYVFEAYPFGLQSFCLEKV